VEWPPLLAAKFPQLSLWEDRLVRLAEGNPRSKSLILETGF
jgi:hypothetical protein